MKAKKFTFKIIHPTGRYKSFYPSYCQIKIDGQDVGTMFERQEFFGTDEHKGIRLQVNKNATDIEKEIAEKGSVACIWKSVTLKKKAATFTDLKTWMNDNFDAIIKSFDFSWLDTKK